MPFILNITYTTVLRISLTLYPQIQSSRKAFWDPCNRLYYIWTITKLTDYGLFTDDI